jgi:hypothetical protein
MLQRDAKVTAGAIMNRFSEPPDDFGFLVPDEELVLPVDERPDADDDVSGESDIDDDNELAVGVI